MQNCLFCGISRAKRRSGKRNQSEDPWLVISLNQTSEEHRKADADKWTHGIYYGSFYYGILRPICLMIQILGRKEVNKENLYVSVECVGGNIQN